jgi:hypothetical protein
VLAAVCELAPVRHHAEEPARTHGAGYCDKRAHLSERCGYGGRRVLVSRHWTGKTLTEHSADRREVVRAVLEAAGIELPDGCPATELREDGEPRWLYEPINPGELHGDEYRQPSPHPFGNRRLARPVPARSRQHRITRTHNLFGNDGIEQGRR